MKIVFRTSLRFVGNRLISGGWRAALPSEHLTDTQLSPTFSNRTVEQTRQEPGAASAGAGRQVELSGMGEQLLEWGIVRFPGPCGN